MAAEGSRARLGDASPRGGEGDARRADRPRGDACEHDRGRVLEINGLPDGRSDRVRPGHRLVSVDDLPVRPERLLAELLPTVGAAHPRAAAFGILRVQGAEELGHLKGDLVRLRPGSVERGHVPHEIDMQVDLRSLRDALEPVGLQAHVESLAVVQAAERDDVERLALHAIAEDQGGGLDCVEGHPPREGRLHRSSLSIAVRNLRGYERIAERAIELPADLEDPDPRPRLDAHGMAEAEVRARTVRAHDLLVCQDGPLDSGPGRETAVRRDRFDPDDPGAVVRQEAWMRAVAVPRDPILTAKILVQARAADLTRLAFGLRPAVDEFVAHVCLPLADERDLDHDEGLGRT